MGHDEAMLCSPISDSLQTPLRRFMLRFDLRHQPRYFTILLLWHGPPRFLMLVPRSQANNRCQR
jgi:hypothetical protein